MSRRGFGTRLTVPAVVALTGATGFVGSAVARQLAAAGVELRPITRTSRDSGEIAPGDIRHHSSLDESLRGVGVLIHAASYIGEDAALAWDVNERGTGILMERACASGVSRIVALSTAAVYGRGPHHRILERSITEQPQSPLSASRLAGEAHVLRAGGSVLRPNLIYGPGDRHFLPSVTLGMRMLQSWVDDGRALISVIHVDELARLMVLIALNASDHEGILHASHPEPVSVRDAVTRAHAAGLPIDVPRRSLPYADARTLLESHPDALSVRQFDLLALEHTYDSEEAWRLAGLQPDVAFDLDDASLRWYAHLLSS